MKCELCEREVDALTEHHLVPRSKGGKKGDTIDVCEQCSKQIHCIHDNKTLGSKLNTLEKLRNDEKIAGYIVWVRNKSGSFKTRRSW